MGLSPSMVVLLGSVFQLGLEASLTEEDSLSAPLHTFLISKKMALASVNVAAQVLAQTCSGMVWALSPNGKQRLRITERQASSRLVPGSCEADPGSRAESQPYGSLVRGFVCSCLGPLPGRGFL